MFDTDSEVQKSITEFVKSNFLMSSNMVKFSNDDSFMEKGIIDSTGVLEMVAFIQQTFGININDDDLIPENLDSVNNITAFIRKKKVGHSLKGDTHAF